MHTPPASLLLPLLLMACAAEAPPVVAKAAPVPVRIAAVRDTTASATITAAGTLGARDELPLAFKVGGVIREITVDAGTRVRAGQRLAVIELAEIDAGVARARAGVEKAERDLARAERLHADSVVTRATLDDARTALALAQADLRAVSFNRGRAEIVAPAAGVVMERLAEPGQLVEAGRTVLHFASDARGKAFRTGLVDRDALRLQLGDAAEVRFDAQPGRTFAAEVVEMAGTATAGTGTYAVVLRLRGGEALPNGLVGRVEIRTRSTGRAQVVPIEALVEADGERGVVFSYDAGTRRAERREVRIASMDGRLIAIADGLTGVQQVVTDGVAYLGSGAEVTVVP